MSVEVNALVYTLDYLSRHQCHEHGALNLVCLQVYFQGAVSCGAYANRRMVEFVGLMLYAILKPLVVKRDKGKVVADDYRVRWYLFKSEAL